jgi:dTDP-4-amino-4,6-dideoxygalactose transaminase
MIKINVAVANWGWQEWLSIFRCIFFGSISQGKSIDKLQAELSQLYPESKVILLNSARAGLAISLHAFQENKPSKKEVIIPDFLCDSVENIIKACGLTPIYAPVGKDLNLNIDLLDGLCTENTLAVILPHMYAKPAQIEQAELALAKKDIYLIDDAAQVAGVLENGKTLGSFGDIGLLSFAQAKTIVTGVRASGGVLFVNNTALVDNITSQLKGLKPSRGRISALQHFLFTYKWHGLTKKVDYYLQRISQKLSTGSQVNYYSPISNISNVDASLALAQFSSLIERINDTKQLISQYQSALALNKNVDLVQVDKEDLYLTRLIIQCKKISPKECQVLLEKQGVMSKFVYDSGSKHYDGSYASG